MLEVQNLSTFYGKAQALWDICLEVRESEVVALVGSNGAGKTTLLNAISGVVRPASGTISFLDQRIDGLSPHSVVDLGISHVPEGGRLFPDMSVRENLELGALVTVNRQRRRELEAEVYTLFPRIKERLSQYAGTLSGGEQQMLAIARAMMQDPRMLLLDEPSLGLAPNLVQEIFGKIKLLNSQGVTILLVEQNAYQALRICHRAHVLEQGRIVMSGSGAELLDNPKVKEAYLGG